ncbi:MAG: hypothetical protein AAF709_05385, partial [Pseudomonadota bacterium]
SGSANSQSDPTEESSAGGGGGGGTGASGGTGIIIGPDIGAPVQISGDGGDNNGGGGGGGNINMPGWDGEDNSGSGGAGSNGAFAGGTPGQDGNVTGGGGSSGGDGGSEPYLGGGGGGGGSGNGGQLGGGGGANGSVAAVTSSPETTRVTTGLQFGYNWQCGRLVYGLEGDWATSGRATDYYAAVRARVGLTSSNHLFYLTAGWAKSQQGRNNSTLGVAAGGGDGGHRGDINPLGTQTRAGPDATFTGGAGGAGAAAQTQTGQYDTGTLAWTGIVIGGGVETRLGQGTSIGLEALYYRFRNDDSQIDPNNFVIRARLNTHFSRERVAANEALTNWRGIYFGLDAGGLLSAGNALSDMALANGQTGGRGGTAPTTGDLPAYDTPGGGGGSGAAAALAFSESSHGLAGLHLGINWQRKRWVLGLEGDLGRAKDRFDYLGTIRGRIGMARDQSLFYLTGGLAIARTSANATGGTLYVNSGQDGQDGVLVDGDTSIVVADFGNGGTGGTASFDRNSSEIETALVLGGGMEVKLRDNLSFGLEGLYYFFDDSATAIDVIDGTTGETFTINADDDDNGGFFTVKARLTYHFGDRDNDDGEYAPLK